MEQHLESGSRGAAWVNRNFSAAMKSAAITVPYAKFTQNVKWEETKKTLEMMVKHGINNVRGAEYCKPDPYTESDVQDKAYAVIHHLDRTDLISIQNGLRKNMAQVNLAAAAALDALPSAFQFGSGASSGTSYGCCGAPTETAGTCTGAPTFTFGGTCAHVSAFKFSSGALSGGSQALGTGTAPPSTFQFGNATHARAEPPVRISKGMLSTTEKAKLKAREVLEHSRGNQGVAHTPSPIPSHVRSLAAGKACKVKQFPPDRLCTGCKTDISDHPDNHSLCLKCWRCLFVT